jgi:NADPH:quinone reductase-like Zn-dependent oxidoreductase
MTGTIASGGSRSISWPTAIRWPSPGAIELVVDGSLPLRQDPDEVLVEVVVSVTSTGTERARFSALPNAAVNFPHTPGYMAAGLVADGPNDLVRGTRVAARGVPHQRWALVRRTNVHPVPPTASLEGAALWELALTALNGLDRGEHVPTEPIAIIGAGLVGALTRRLAVARGTTSCLVAAESDSKRWTIRNEVPAPRFMIADQLRDADRQAYPLVVDATGSARGLVLSSLLAAPDGRIVLLGSPRALTAPVPVRDLQRRGVQIVGAHVQTLAARSRRDGADHVHRLTEEFFRRLDDGLLLDDLLDHRPPSLAAEAFGQLFADRSAVAVAFDWSGAVPDRSSTTGRR